MLNPLNPNQTGYVRKFKLDENKPESKPVEENKPEKPVNNEGKETKYKMEDLRDLPEPAYAVPINKYVPKSDGVKAVKEEDLEKDQGSDCKPVSGKPVDDTPVDITEPVPAPKPPILR